jgi:hypothetical protein
VRNGQTFINGVAVNGTTALRPQVMSVVSVVLTGDVAADAFGTYRGTSNFWWGDLGEMIVYDRALSSVERKAVEDYLFAKWNVTGDVTMPVISPAGGFFSGSQEVSLSTVTAGASIHYTLDRSEPTLLSDLYTTPLVIDATTTVKAKAFRDDLTDSQVATASFTRDTDVTPRSVSGLQLWWRADVGTTGGDFVPDQSGLGNDALQGNGGGIATLVAGAQNGLPVLRFDGNSDFLNFTTRLTNLRTVFWVVKEDSAATSASRMLLGDVALGGLPFHGGTGAPGTLWSSSASANVKNGQTFINGVAVNGTTALRPQVMSVVSVVLAGDESADAFGTYRGTTNFWFGDLAEMIIYDRPLDTTERQQVEAYLKTKYGTP